MMRTIESHTDIIRALLVALALAVLAPGCATTPTGGGATPSRIEAKRAIGDVLDTLHASAASADEDAYFALYAPEAVFLGTDATERWTLSAFRAFAMPYFQRDSAWIYEPIERHVALSPDGRFAWFDERLMNERFGECRGSGALRLIDGQWRITQYNLTIPIPNDLVDEVVARIGAH